MKGFALSLGLCMRQSAESLHFNASLICIITAFVSDVWLLWQSRMDLMDAELFQRDMR